MFKKIYSYLVLFSLLVACKDETVGITTYTRKIDMSKSSISSYQLQSAFLYSIDDGNTFVAFPNLKNGQTYQAKIVYNPDPDNYTFPDEGSIQEVTICPFLVDWTASDPQPKSVDSATGIATFVAGGKNSVVATVTNIPFNAQEAAGTYAVVNDDWADFNEGDLLTVQRIDDTHIKVVEYPATAVNHAGLVITITNSTTGVASVASQDSGAYSDPNVDEETTSGTGVVSSCAGTIDLTLKFVLAGKSYAGNVLSLKKK